MKWTAKWIGVEESDVMPVLIKEINVDKEIGQATLYIYGLGLFEVYLNQERVGDEYLMPGYHSYDMLLQYRTFDVKDGLVDAKNTIEVILGNGWYKGRFGFDGVYDNLYGDQKMVIAELHITYTDGSRDLIFTDQTWSARESCILENNIYDGETMDETRSCQELEVKIYEASTDLLVPKMNPALRKTDKLRPKIIEHSDGYLLLDFGKIISGWVEFSGEFRPGQTIQISYGELLQNDEFYNDNLRTALAEFNYTSDGIQKMVRPHFTFYGFRYAKIEGAELSDFDVIEAYQLMSDIDRTGYITTSNDKVNTLFENTLNSQKSNFVDIPTDCPQRDERMGWTGDVAIFAGTACFHMDCLSFFNHYLYNMKLEQVVTGGSIPFFVPRPKIKPHEGINPFYISHGASMWGDVATILPWTLFEYYGDKDLLKDHYPIMVGWVDYITNRTKENVIPYLWQNDRQLGDWLALDNGNIHNPIGLTDQGYIASILYYHSVDLTAKAARVIGDSKYEALSILKEKIFQAIQNEFFDEKGYLTVIETQTAIALALYFKLYNNHNHDYLIKRLKQLLDENNGYLNTGFVGTPVLLKALSENGLNEYAYGLLLNESYPSWLYQVNQGATTIWERWNSILEDGSISGTDMNSMNHYAYGSVAEWMYRYMCGLRPQMHKEIKMVIKPMPHKSVNQVSASWSSKVGVYKSSWCYHEGKIKYFITIPVGASALVLIGDKEQVLNNGNYVLDGLGNIIV